MIRYWRGWFGARENICMRYQQMQLFDRSTTVALRDRTKARNYSPAGDEFRRDQVPRRRWGLRRRYGWKRCREHGCSRECGELGLHDDVEAVPPLIWPEGATRVRRPASPAPNRDAPASHPAASHRPETATPTQPAHQAEPNLPAVPAPPITPGMRNNPLLRPPPRPGPSPHARPVQDPNPHAGPGLRVGCTLLPESSAERVEPAGWSEAVGRHGPAEAGRTTPASRSRHTVRARSPPGTRPPGDADRPHRPPNGTQSTGSNRAASPAPSGDDTRLQRITAAELAHAEKLAG
ncbi:hypothetical protein BJ973_009705 [Actinoplanes tereljensis]|uniref:Uncharacterized protein n=1 Tax=Paractinoplanes tereljensis TaxID=571912 RepID=A0A919NF69_9ACTN|nr:hypothetical protein Ate02nite_00630 [Actinoplanes tereljensis]